MEKEGSFEQGELERRSWTGKVKQVVIDEVEVKEAQMRMYERLSRCFQARVR